jgi:two-component system chemotaxis sensor kinase CheA
MKDWLLAYFAAISRDTDLPPAPQDLIAAVERARASEAAASAQAPAEPEQPEDDPPRAMVDPDLVSDFISEANEHLDQADEHMLALEADPTREDELAAVFRGFHTIKGVAGFLQLGEIKNLAHEAETVLDAARKGDLRLEGAAFEAVFEAVDVLRHLVAAVAEAAGRGDLPASSPRAAPLLEKLRAIQGESPDPAVEATPEVRPAAPLRLAQEEPAVPAQRGGHGGIRELIKIDAERLDRLVDAIGELVIAECMLSRSTELQATAGSPLANHLGRVSKITRELQEMGTSLRMVPLRSTFQKMARLSRDLSRKLDKPLEFVLRGEDTELDKTVVDQIGDPLIHLVRNAVDHGLEPSAAARVAAGKQEAGRVELRAYHQGGEVIIEIADDGRGLDRDAILRKARDRGVVGPDAVLSDDQVYRLIFAPGFSTAAQVTDVSGRGVGLDVVAQNIEALRGRSEVETTLGKGTVFRLRLPLTLAIIDGMVLRVGPERYVLPTLSIVRMIHPDPTQLRSVLERGEMLQTSEGLVPLLRLEELLHGRGAGTDKNDPAAVVVVVESGSRRVGLLASELLGQQQVVIKPLGSALAGVPGLSGGAIMADGKVGLVIDAAGLVRSGEPERAAAA